MQPRHEVKEFLCMIHRQHMILCFITSTTRR